MGELIPFPSNPNDAVPVTFETRIPGFDVERVTGTGSPPPCLICAHVQTCLETCNTAAVWDEANAHLRDEGE